MGHIKMNKKTDIWDPKIKSWVSVVTYPDKDHYGNILLKLKQIAKKEYQSSLESTFRSFQKAYPQGYEGMSATPIGKNIAQIKGLKSWKDLYNENEFKKFKDEYRYYVQGYVGDLEELEYTTKK